MAASGVCDRTGCVPAEVVSGSVDDGDTTGGVTGAGVVSGAEVVVVVMVECSTYDSKIVRPNRALSTSLEPETKNEQGYGGIVWFHLSDVFVRNFFMRTYFFQNFRFGNFFKCSIFDAPLQTNIVTFGKKLELTL